jgi:hypothetical protein
MHVCTLHIRGYIFTETYTQFKKLFCTKQKKGKVLGTLPSSVYTYILCPISAVKMYIFDIKQKQVGSFLVC